MELIKDVLESKGIKPTMQRLAVLKFLNDHKTHQTVERLYSYLSKTIPTLSRTTIYNTLKVLVDAGLVRELYISPTEVRFDGDIENHHHFYCEKCRQIYDIDIDCPQQKMGEIHGHRINEVHGYFKGICHECQ